MKEILHRILLLFTACLPLQAFAFHIIGGELNYRCLGNYQFEITLKIYRDCAAANAANFDDPAVVGIFNSSGALVDGGVLSLSFPGSVQVQPDISNPCLQVPPGICVEYAVYKGQAFLPPIPGGYDITYQRCCRNISIVNIEAPSSQGATYTAHIPDDNIASCNSNPFFNNYPPIVICVNEPLIVDQSATDIDGDSLVYSLCAPYAGADPNNPQPAPPPPPPYYTVVWVPPYGPVNEVGGNPPLTIDPKTGLLQGHPTAIGKYVVGVCVSEYRKGVLLGNHIRDFQFNVTTCDPTIIANFKAEEEQGEKADTLLVCTLATVNFENLTYGSNDFFWDFGAPQAGDTSHALNPSFTYPDTGYYKVTLIASRGLPCGDTTYRYLEIRRGVAADFTFKDLCSYTPMPFFSDSSTSQDGTLEQWNWKFGDGTISTQQNPVHTYQQSGFYPVTLTLTDNHGCTATVTKQVDVKPSPNPNAQPDTFICNIDTIMLHADGSSAFRWQPDISISDTASANPFVNPQVTTTYTVTVLDSMGCIGRDSVNVRVTDTVIADVSSDTIICEGQSVQLLASNASYYRWSPSTALSSTDIPNPVSSPTTNITYYVTSYVGSCFDKDTVTILVNPLPQPDAGFDVTINQGDSTMLEASGGVSYNWDPASTLNNSTAPNPIANPINSTTYDVLVTGANGCSAKAEVTVDVTHNHLIFVPNAFTPNGDGINDKFSFYTKGVEEIESVQIFDRWGEVIFASGSDNYSWDGTFKGKPCEIGTYVYLITGRTYDGDLINERGTVTLIR